MTKEIEEEFIDHDIVHWNELTSAAKDRALWLFVKYGCCYQSPTDFGVPVEATIEDLDNPVTKKLIIKALKQMQFEEDGTIF